LSVADLAQNRSNSEPYIADMRLVVEFLIGIGLIIVLLILLFHDNAPTVNQWLESIGTNRGFIKILD